MGRRSRSVWGLGGPGRHSSLNLFDFQQIHRLDQHILLCLALFHLCPVLLPKCYPSGPQLPGPLLDARWGSTGVLSTQIFSLRSPMRSPAGPHLASQNVLTEPSLTSSLSFIFLFFFSDENWPQWSPVVSKHRGPELPKCSLQAHLCLQCLPLGGLGPLLVYNGLNTTAEYFLAFSFSAC